MPRTRPAYPPEFRHQMVELIRSGRSIRETARDFECSEQTIRNWLRQAELDQGLRDDVSETAGTEAASIMADCPPFQLETNPRGDVGVPIAGEYVHTWLMAELR